MKRLLLTSVVILSLGGCASGGVQLTTAKALLISEAAVDGANHTATASYGAGLTGIPAKKVHDAVGVANTTVGAAHAAYLAGKMAEVITNLNKAFDAVAVVQENKP